MNSKKKVESQALTVKEAAATLRLSETSCRRAIRKHFIKYFRIGGKILISKSEINRLLSGRAMEGRSN